MKLEPIVDWIGPIAIEHGERDLLDPEHPTACLCGHEYYLWCLKHTSDGKPSRSGLCCNVTGWLPDPRWVALVEAAQPVELRGQHEGQVVLAGDKRFAITGSDDNGLSDLADDGSVLLGRYTLGLLPTLAMVDQKRWPGPHVEVDPGGGVCIWHSVLRWNELDITPRPVPGESWLVLCQEAPT